MVLQPLFALAYVGQMHGIAPSIAIQPLYVCSMNTASLPDFVPANPPTPEMQAATIGMSLALKGMSEYWNINDDDDDASSYYTNNLPVTQLSSNQGSGSKPAASPAPSTSTRPPASPGYNPGYIVPRSLDSAALVTSTGSGVQQESISSADLNAGASSAKLPALDISPGLITAAAAAVNDLDTAEGTEAARMARRALSSDGTSNKQHTEMLDSDLATPSGKVQSSQVDVSAVAADSNVPPASSTRALLQTTTKAQVCNKGTPTASSSSTASSRPGYGPATGFKGIDMATTGVIPPDPTVAVGPDTAIHVVNSLVAIYKVNPQSGTPLPKDNPAPAKFIPLPNFFSLVASPCDGGYFSPDATYDKQVGRFLLTAVCGGDANQILLAISATSSALGNWILYSFAGEVTQSTPMACGDYPAALHTKVTYNQDGVYISYVQNCPSQQDSGTGAVLYALPKWAVYRGATYFWAPVWTAWDVYRASGVTDLGDIWSPLAFLQLQPVMPQRPADVLAEVVYFLSDNYVYNYAAPLQRTEFTVTALINTGSLWYYEGPSSSSPAPLLVAKIVARGMKCFAAPTTKLLQPYITPTNPCEMLDAGAMRPPGFWSGGAALYANQIYLADRGPDKVDMYGNNQPTIYWAIITPSFCVSGPCAPWFGSDWGRSSGWNWATRTWSSNSERARNSYTDPSYYNQVFVYPGSNVRGRRRLQETRDGSAVGSGQATAAGWTGQERVGRKLTATNDLGIIAASSSDAAAADSSMTAVSGYQTRTSLVTSRDQMRASVRRVSSRNDTKQVAAASVSVTDGQVYKVAVRRSNSDSPRVTFRTNRGTMTLATNGTVTTADISSKGTVSATNVYVPRVATASSSSFQWRGFIGWGYPAYYSDYYNYRAQYYYARSQISFTTSIAATANPCKYYKDWGDDNSITFGAIVGKSGVIDMASAGVNPLGVAFPQVAVSGGVMAVVFSYAGPRYLPNSNQQVLAYPGVGYTTVPGGNFTLIQPGAACIDQGIEKYWGLYSGMDIHPNSSRAWSAVEYAATQKTDSMISNAAIWLSVI